MDKSYNYICAIADTCKQPTVKVTPIMTFTQFHGNIMRETVNVMIEARGSDGSYTRSFTERTVMEKQI